MALEYNPVDAHRPRTCGPQPRRTALLAAVVLVWLVPGLCRASGRDLPCRAVRVDVVVDDVAALPSSKTHEAFANWRKAALLDPGFPGPGYYRSGGAGLYSGWGEPLLIMPGDNAIPGPPAEWLFAYERTFLGRKHPIAIESVKVNRSPRRIIFVAEDGTEMTPAGRAIESAVITDVLSKARPEDSFALLAAGGPRIALHFGASRAHLLAAAKDLAKTPPAAAVSEGVRDALLEATKWFHGHQPGDAIFVLTMGLEGKTPGFLGTLRIVSTFGLAQKREASFKQVRRAALRHHIRVFGFQLGRTSYNPPACPVSTCGVTIQPDESNEATYFGVGAAGRVELLELCLASFGGFPVSGSGVDTQRAGYRLTKVRLTRLERYAETMYKMASEYYILRLSSTSKNLVIGLKPRVQDRFPWSFVSYSSDNSSCSSPAAPRSAKTRSGHKPRSRP